MKNNIVKSLAKGGALAFSSHVFSGILGILITLLLTRSLGARNFGIYALGMALFRISAKISLFGMNNGILRFFPIYRKSSDELRGLFYSIFLVVITTSIVFSISYFFCANKLAISVFKAAEFEMAIRMFALGLPLLVCIDIIAFTFQSERQILKYLTIGDLYQKIIFLSLLGIMACFGLRLVGTILVFLLSLVVVLIIGLINFIKYIFPLFKGSFRDSQIHFKELLYFSTPSLLIGFSFILLTHIDRIMIGIFQDTSDVGIYVVSAKIAISMNIVLASFNTIFVPYISKLYHDNKKEELANMFKLVTKWIWACSLVLFAFFMCFADPLLALFGEEFSCGRFAFIILSFSFLLNSASGSNGFVLQMVGRQYVELINCIIVVIVNVVLNLILIPKFGFDGAALATGISLVAVNIARLCEIFHMLGMHPFSMSYLKISLGFVLSSLTAIGTGYITNLGLESQITSFLVFLAVYFSFLHFMCLTEEDQFIANGIKNKLSAVS